MEKPYMEAARNLFSVVAKLDDPEKVAAFFEDICTIKEVQDLSQRWQVANMLSRGESYQKISRETGASTATICRVNKCLVYGAGGYRAALGIEKKENGEDVADEN